LRSFSASWWAYATTKGDSMSVTLRGLPLYDYSGDHTLSPTPSHGYQRSDQ
jgi:hypothetical protein